MKMTNMRYDCDLHIQIQLQIQIQILAFSFWYQVVQGLGLTGGSIRWGRRPIPLIIRFTPNQHSFTSKSIEDINKFFKLSCYCRRPTPLIIVFTPTNTPTLFSIYSLTKSYLIFSLLIIRFTAQPVLQVHHIHRVIQENDQIPSDAILTGWPDDQLIRWQDDHMKWWPDNQMIRWLDDD